ncbi:MAG: FecR family protein [Candidatus Omnitrophota bacterium]
MLKYSLALFILLASGIALADGVLISSEGTGVEIVQLSGQVEVSIGGADFEAAEEDIFLQAGDKIKTGRDSYAELAFDEDGENCVRVESESSAIFTLGEREKIELQRGEIFSTMNNLPPGSTFEIKTPSAVCGVRGTDWVTRASDEGMDVETLEGRVYAKGFDERGRLRAEETVVLPGYTTKVRKHQRPTAPVKFSYQKRARLRKLKDDVKARAHNVINDRRRLPGHEQRRDRMINSQKRWHEKGKVVPRKGDQGDLKREPQRDALQKALPVSRKRLIGKDLQKTAGPVADKSVKKMPPNKIPPKKMPHKQGAPNRR